MQNIVVVLSPLVIMLKSLNLVVYKSPTANIGTPVISFKFSTRDVIQDYLKRI